MQSAVGVICGSILGTSCGLGSFAVSGSFAACTGQNTASIRLNNRLNSARLNRQ